MTSLIDRTRPIGAVVVGRAGIDLYPLPDGTKIEAAEMFGADIGGSAGNIAVALARQGIRSCLVSPLSADPVGRFVRASLNSYGVDTSRCREIADGKRTSLALAETRPNDAQVVIYRNGAADLCLRKEDADVNLIGSSSILVLTGTALASEPSRTAVMEFLKAAAGAKTFAILDIDHRPYSWASTAEARSLYLQAGKLCSAVVGNQDEFALIAGQSRQAFEAAAGFVKHGSEFVILKKGIGGSLTITANATFETGIFTVALKKPFGSGDAFIAGVIAALLAGRTLKDAVRRGTASAAHVVSRRGCASAMPTTAEVESLIARQDMQ
jgi:5-dehydro-2-deoxygluconokinase